jgi:BCCT family betaine/carnitine transporter
VSGELKKPSGGVLEKPSLIIAIIVILCMAIPTIIWPKESEKIVLAAHAFITGNFGSYYLLFGLGVFILIIIISLTKIGSIYLGSKDDKPEYNTFTWLMMNFCCGVATGVIIWGTIEWVYYYMDPPLHTEYGSALAAEIASSYPLFHWGLLGWSIYSIAGCAFAYILHVRKINILRLSEACRPLFGKLVDGVVGKIINVIFVFGLLGASATALGLAAPFVSELICKVTGFPHSTALDVLVLVIVCTIYGTSTYLGLKRGMKRLSDLSTVLLIVYLGYVLIASKTTFIIDMGTTGFGTMLNNFFKMSTWLDPVGKSGFAQSWTAFYWASYIGFGPFVGMFFAKISKGRTIRQMLLGAVLGGSVASWIFMMILGGHGIYLQTSGLMDIVGLMNANGQARTIVDILSAVPGSIVVNVVCIVLCLGLLATSYDSASYCLASNCQSQLDEKGDPKRWLRLLWALLLCVIPISFILMGAPLKPLQTMTIVLAFPLSFVVILTIICFFRMVHADAGKGIITLKVSHGILGAPDARDLIIDK